MKSPGIEQHPPVAISRSSRLDFSAISIGSDVPAIAARANGRGVVHSSFSRSLNLLFAKNEIVSVVDHSVGKSPFNVVANFTQELGTFHLKNGDPVRVGSDSFLIGDSLEIITRHAERFVSRHDFRSELLDIPGIKENVRDMKKITANFGNFEGFHFLGTRIRGEVYSLVSSIEKNDLEGIRASCHALLGLGLGLTPSADDLLSGLMLACHLFTENLNGNMEEIRKVNTAILHHSAQTTVLSQNYLRHAAVGNGTDLAQSVVGSLLTAKRGSRRMESATTDLLSVGSTSGTDTAVGILLGSILSLRKAGKEMEIRA